MAETLQEVLSALILAGVFAIIGWLLKSRKQRILSAITGLIKEAEKEIKGSKLGDQRKAQVVAQLEAMGITVNTKLSGEIDKIVDYLNSKSAWFTSSATEKADAAIQDAAESIVEGTAVKNE